MTHKALSDKYFGTIVGAYTNIIRYFGAQAYNRLGRAPRKSSRYCIVLCDSKPDRGHWTALSKYYGIYDHFDPYGAKPDKSLEWVNLKMRQRLNKATPYLTNLLNNKQYIYNNVNHHDRDGNLNTCGSHAVRRLYRLNDDGMDLQTYNNYIKYTKDEFGANCDAIVAESVNKRF